MWFKDGNGWRDENTESPCYTLRRKRHYIVVQYDFNSPILVVNELTEEEFSGFHTINEAKKFADRRLINE